MIDLRRIELAPDVSPSSLPSGFSAVVQCDGRLAQFQLVQNLRALGAAELTARVQLPDTGLPPEVVTALAPFVGPVLTVLSGQSFLELRLVFANLLTLGPTPAPVTGGGVVINSTFLMDDEGPPVDAEEPRLRLVGALVPT